MRRYVQRYCFLRGLALALMGPALGFMSALLINPGLLLIAVFGRYAWVIIYGVGFVPSIVTTTCVIWLQINGIGRFKIAAASIFVSAGSAAMWCATLVPLPKSLGLYVVLFASASAGLLLGLINHDIVYGDASRSDAR